MSLFYTIFVIAFIIPQLHGLQNKTVIKQSIRSVLGKYLRGHVFKVTSQAVDPQHCLADCWAENDRCQSFNYFPDFDICELNEASNLTAPLDLIDRPRIVYLTNPLFGREKIPQMSRHTQQMPASPDPCASNPCTHAKSCVKNDKLGYRCKHCDHGYTGPRCEEHVDPCKSSPCQWGGTCVSVMTSWSCKCPFPFYGTRCTRFDRGYQFDLDGTGSHPYATLSNIKFDSFTANFWFKTAEENVSYFTYAKPNDAGKPHRFNIWRVENTFFVELWKDFVYNFTFPTSYPVNDNNWHLVTIVLDRTAELSFYLDGVMRDTPKLTKGLPGADNLYIWERGVMHLGYFKDLNGHEYFFNGSIGSFDIEEKVSEYYYIRDYMLKMCVPRFVGIWAEVKWKEIFNLARPIDCSSRIPIMGIAQHEFYGTSTWQWFEHAISPPRTLTAFTIVFQLLSTSHPDKPLQIACYGDQGAPCRLSVVIHVNMTMETIIESTRGRAHLIVMTWTNEGGVFELIIDGILQSRVLQIENNGRITGQSRFMLGGSDVENRNYAGQIHNFNVWDKVLSEDMLYLISSQPGNDMGNVVAWKDFKKPSSISEEHFDIVKHSKRTDFLSSTLGRYDSALEFGEAPAYSSSKIGCCGSIYRLTLIMWIALSRHPATLFTFKRNIEETEDMVVQVKSNGEIVLSMDNSDPQNASLGFIPANVGKWNFLAVTWSSTGDLHCNINGKHNHTSSNFKRNYPLDMNGGVKWTIGGKNDSLVGKVAQVNTWFRDLPPPALMALSRGINGITSGGSIQWPQFYEPKYLVGNVHRTFTLKYYMPDFVYQNERDKFCDTKCHECNKCYARLGMATTNGRILACFCEDQLSEDMNFNYGEGHYTYNVQLRVIKRP